MARQEHVLDPLRVAHHPLRAAAFTVGATGEGTVLDTIMHGRTRMTMDPRTPAMPGRSTLGFHLDPTQTSTALGLHHKYGKPVSRRVDHTESRVVCRRDERGARRPKD